MQKIILASNSPRRKELLAKMGVEFECIPSNFDEYLDDSRPVEEVVNELALGKALDVANRYPDALVVGSDTLPTLHGRQLGKMPDEQAARKLLREMSGQPQEVFTSVALVCKATGLREVRVDRAAVVFAPYGDDVIEKFLASNAWQDKAAATAIQHPDTPPVDYIVGDYDTILGLSTRLLAEMLSAQGVKAEPHHPKHALKSRQVA